MPVSLDEILASTRRLIPPLHQRRADLERAAAQAPVSRPLETALQGDTVAVIAEVKRRSPSAGLIRELDPATHAAAYARAGASAISVLTDGPFFGGSLDDLRNVVARVSVPVLRKDFILDELQILEARAAGASAILLIVRVLPAMRLGELIACAKQWHLDALVEVHTHAELAIALEAGAGIVGVNSRDLDTFAIDTAGAWRVLRQVPAGVVAVAESGMATQSDVESAAMAGADAVLMGTVLSAAADPETVLAGLTGVQRRARQG
jgi:indole-3-glycerol phosphate synthase